MSFQAKTNQIINTVGSVARGIDSAQTPSTPNQQPQATTQKPIKPSYDDQVAEMANNMAMNLLTSKRGQADRFKSRVEALNKMASDALMKKNALDAEALERGAK